MQQIIASRQVQTIFDEAPVDFHKHLLYTYVSFLQELEAQTKEAKAKAKEAKQVAKEAKDISLDISKEEKEYCEIEDKKLFIFYS